MAMATSPDWIGMEDAIARLLPSGGPARNRALLLADLSAYARTVVREARRARVVAPTLEESARALGWLERPVFVCGHHRSGTTLLQQLLDGHPQLLVLPSEGTYFTSFDYAARADPAPRDIDRFIADWIARLVDPNQDPHFKLGRSGPHGNPSLLFAQRLLGWRVALVQARPALATFALLLALVAAFRDVAAPLSAPRLWVEKTPLNERNVQRLSAFSQARFIQLVREPGATLASLLELYRAAGSGEFDPAEHAQTIRRSLQLAHKHVQRFRGRYLIVRYEDLTDNPVQEMERVGAFLGISPDPAMSTPTVVGRAARSNSSFKQGGAGVVERWGYSATLPPQQARLISAFTASVARPLGYHVAQLTVLTRSAIHLRQLPSRAFRRTQAWIRRALLPIARRWVGAAGSDHENS